MRIALFTDSNIHYSDGVARIVQELIRHIERHSAHSILVIDRSGGGDGSIAGPNVEVVHLVEPALRIPGYDAYPWFYLKNPKRRLLRKVAEFRPDVLLTVTPYIPRGIGMSAFYAGRKLDLPVVGSFDLELGRNADFYLHVIFRVGLVVRFFRWFIGRRMSVFHRCAHILVPSLTMREHVRGCFPGMETTLFRRAVDSAAFAPTFRSDAFRARHRLRDKVVILFVGRMALEKNLRALARAYANLKARRPEAALLLVGDGPERAVIRDLRLPDVVLPGILRGGDLAEAYASADLFAFPSLAEAGPMVILEAMASGLPVVVTSSGGAHEGVRDGETGFVVPDMPEFEARLEELVARSDLRSTMSANARLHAETQCWDGAWALVLEALDGAAARVR